MYWIFLENLAPDPVIFFEPKILYRMSEDMVPEEDYEVPLRKAEVLKEGKDVTLLGYGASIRQLQMVKLWFSSY